ncbi:Uncharacterised protein [Mycobacterium tuberculosis]|nr:Uncharacterised protein [Mycobacterium tuberculosis]
MVFLASHTIQSGPQWYSSSCVSKIPITLIDTFTWRGRPSG